MLHIDVHETCRGGGRGIDWKIDADIGRITEQTAIKCKNIDRNNE